MWRRMLLVLAVAITLPAQTNIADEESPVGVIDGVNARFLLANPPNPLTSVHVYLNGLRQQKGLAFDYTAFITTASGRSRGAILFNPCCIPQPGSVITVDYRF